MNSKDNQNTEFKKQRKRRLGREPGRGYYLIHSKKNIHIEVLDDNDVNEIKDDSLIHFYSETSNTNNSIFKDDSLD